MVAAGRQYERYVEFCNLRALGPGANYVSYTEYLIWYTKTNQSTRSLPNVMSQLDSECTRRNLPKLSITDRAKVKSIVAELRLRDRTDVRRVRPLLRDYLRAMDVQCWRDKSQPAKALEEQCLLYLGHDGLFRTGELIPKGKLRVQDFTFLRKKVIVHLGPTKTVRLGRGVDVTIPDYDGECAFKLLRKLFECNNIWRSPEALVFPTFKTTDSVRKLIKQCCSKIGLNPDFYSGHSMRAGGATDLFVARTPYHIIKKYGRWKSDAALAYFRDDNDVEDAVRTAFGGSA